MVNTQCPGYPDPLIFSDVNEINFYVSQQTVVHENLCDFGCTSFRETMCYLFWEELIHGGSSTSVEADSEASKIACSLIMSNTTDCSIQKNHKLSHDCFVSNWNEILDQQKPVIILCHGSLSWRNQWLLHSLAVTLSRSLDCHTLRFDFCGNGHSLGEWRYANYDAELNDLQQIVRYVEHTMRCKILCIIGHSKGAASVLRFAWEQDSLEYQSTDSVGGKVPCFVNLAGRYTKPGGNHSLAAFSESQRRQLEETGAVHVTTRGNRKFVVTKEDIEERAKQDMSNVSLITSTVLTVHGDQDRIVPVDNAFQFDSTIKNHQNCIISGADHNFNGSISMEKLQAVVCNFIREQMDKQWHRCIQNE